MKFMTRMRPNYYVVLKMRSSMAGMKGFYFIGSGASRGMESRALALWRGRVRGASDFLEGRNDQQRAFRRNVLH